MLDDGTCDEFDEFGGFVADGFLEGCWGSGQESGQRSSILVC